MSESSGKNIWGGILKAPGSPADGEKICRLQASSAELGRLLEHWASLPSNDRPILHGVTASGTATPSLELLLNQGKNSPLVVLEVEPHSSYPRPSAVWPYSLWWEEELRTFDGIEFAEMIPERDAAWRPL